MGILTRSEDASVQRMVLSANAGLSATGATAIIGLVPSSCVVDGGMVAATGLSLAPTVAIVANRFIPGSGFTAITIAAAAAVVAFGTSGVPAAGIAFGATTLLMANDILMYQVGGSTAAATGLSVNVILKPLQDVTTRFGVI